MKNSPLRYFLIPLGALAAIAFLFATINGSEYAWLVVIPIVFMAGVYSLRPQVEWWYWQRVAPDLSTDYAPILERFNFYRSLDPEGKREFRRRTFLLKESTQFLGRGIEEINDDIQVMVAASAATISYYRKDFAFPEFDTVVFYPHQFPSPQHEILHASEFYVADGTFIFTLNYFVRSVMESDKYLQLGLYEFARAYRIVYPGTRLPEPEWDAVEKISRFSHASLKNFIGLDELDVGAIGLVLYFTHSQRFSSLYPEEFTAYDNAIRPPVG
jgi:hypothetical protein